MWDYIHETCYNLVHALIQRYESTVCHVTYNEILMILEEKFIRYSRSFKEKIEQPEQVKMKDSVHLCHANAARFFFFFFFFLL